MCDIYLAIIFLLYNFITPQCPIIRAYFSKKKMINLIPEKYPSSPIKTSEVNRVKVSGTQSQELLPSGTLKVKIYYLLTVMYFLCFVT
jgi:hypothetical protein